MGIWARTLRRRRVQDLDRSQITSNGEKCDSITWPNRARTDVAEGHDPYLVERQMRHPLAGGAGSFLASKVGSFLASAEGRPVRREMEERCCAVALWLWRPAVCSGLGATAGTRRALIFCPNLLIRCITRHIIMVNLTFLRRRAKTATHLPNRHFGPVTIGTITDREIRDSRAWRQ